MRQLQQRVIPHLIVAFTLVICICIYWEGLYGPLLLDDISNLGKVLSPNFGKDDIFPNLFSGSGPLKRPVSMLSFIANGLSGGSLFYWKLTNLIIHFCCGVLLYLLIFRLTHLTKTEGRLIAAVTTAVWILHPLQVSTVLYLVQRMTELSALFVILAMLTYTIARERQQKKRTSWPMQALTWLVFFPLGAFSKENALLFPGFVILLEIFFFQREKISNQQLFKVGIFSTLFFSVLFWAFSDRLLGGYSLRDFSPIERLYTESRIIIDYLGMLLIPALNKMGFTHDDVSISHGLLDPITTLPSILTIITLITVGFFLRKKYPLIGFGIIFFFLGHAVESTVIPLELMYEHRNYLPSVGIFLAATCTMNIIVKNRGILTAFSIAIFCLFIFVTYLRTNTWASTVSIYYHMEMTHPRSERLATIKATLLTNIGEYSLARKRLEGFNSIGAKLQQMNINCAEHHKLGDDQLDIDLSELNLADNYAIMQLTNLANLGIDKECKFSSDTFLSLLKTIGDLPSISTNNRQIVLIYQAHYLWKLNRQDEALKTLHRTFDLDKKNPTPLFLACKWMLDTNRGTESTETCNTALKIASETPFNKYKNLADETRNRLNAISSN